MINPRLLSNRDFQHLARNAQWEGGDGVFRRWIHRLSRFQIKPSAMRWAGNPAIANSATFQSLIGVRAFVLDGKKFAATVTNQNGPASVIEHERLARFHGIDSDGGDKFWLAHVGEFLFLKQLRRQVHRVR